MRRSDREVTARGELIEILRNCDTVRLAMNDGDYPYILPLNFGFEERDGLLSLYFHGAKEGRKYEILARDNRVSFEADCAHRLVLDEEKGACTMEYASVIGRGKVSIVEGREEKLYALRRIMAHYGREEFPFREETADRTAVMRLDVEGMTGKRRIKR